MNQYFKIYCMYLPFITIRETTLSVVPKCIKSAYVLLYLSRRERIRSMLHCRIFKTAHALFYVQELLIRRKYTEAGSADLQP